MKEKELRLALVFFGGVSLAIYQHGINREIVSLLRASKAYQSANSFEEKQSAEHRFDPAPGHREEASTEDVYFDLLKEIGRTTDLRVLVDVITGSSAGGINAIALARAISHNLSLAPLTDLWLAEADMTRLLAPEAKARAWSKWYFAPLINPMLARLRREGLFPDTADAEMRERVSEFLRSRWFKPPLDGRRLTNLLLDGLMAMGTPHDALDSLLPSANRLDLLVTVTDFNGVNRSIFIHDPAVVQEREHRHVLRFHYDRSRGAPVHSDFDLASVPSLAFAGRGSASYPGAFPPAQLSEFDAVLAERDLAWPTRSSFLDVNFGHYRDLGLDPQDAILVDGSVLDNKPIIAAVEAIRNHRAFREVDRRLVYIDPHATMASGQAGTEVPSFIAVLRRALTDLPRHEPIYDELAEISSHNKKIRRLKAAILAARPQVAALIKQATASDLERPFDVDELRHWRLTSTNLLAATPIVYNMWMRTLVLESIDFVGKILSGICKCQRESQQERWIQEVVEAWAQKENILTDNYVIPPTVERDSDLPAFARFIVSFGVEYKRRRLSFVIQQINNLYARLGQPDFCTTPSTTLDLLKEEIYGCLDQFRTYEDSMFLSSEVIARARELLDVSRASAAGTSPDPVSFAHLNEPAITGLLEELDRECNLVSLNEHSDLVLASPIVMGMGVNCRREIITGYLGYFYWDILLRPTTGALAVGGSMIEEILVDRISPDDAATIRLDGGGSRLRGASVAGFGGFLSRAARENDYLWGRLHSIDRLFDILLSTMAREQESMDIEILDYKKRAFDAVLRSEAARLSSIPELIAQIRTAVANLQT